MSDNNAAPNKRYTRGELILYSKIDPLLFGALNIIPLKPLSKQPLVKWGEYRDKLYDGEFPEGCNYAAIAGRGSTYVIDGVTHYLVVLDLDSPELYEKVKDTPTLVIRTPNDGYHLYFWGVEPVKTERPCKDVEIKGDGAYVVIPPSKVVNDKGEVREYVVVNEKLPNEWAPWDYSIVTRLCGERPPPPIEVESAKERALKPEEIARIAELLKPYYQPGYRDYIVHYLSGWLRKAGVSYESARALLDALIDRNKDPEWRERYRVLNRTYGIQRDHEGIPGALTPPEITKLRGKSGLLEVLEEIAGEQRAEEIMKELEEILGVPSPHKDIVFVLLDADKQLYAVANLRKRKIARAQLRGKVLHYKEIVAYCAPVEVTVYINPITQLTKYEIAIEMLLANNEAHRIKLPPMFLNEVIDRLVELEGVVYHSRLFRDVFVAIINRMVRSGRANIKREIENPGFYLGGGGVIAVPGGIEPPSNEELEKALDLVNELGGWDEKTRERLALVLKWGAIAPFSFILKQKGKPLKWLYLYGDTATGKTTLGRIVLAMWGLGASHETSGAGIDTVPRLGEKLRQSTYPLLVNEPGGALAREDVLEALKNAVDSTVVRGKFVKGAYIEYPALAPVIFTSNRDLPKDDAFRRRLIVVMFSYSEKIPPERQEQFKERVLPRLRELSALGRFIANEVLTHPEILDLSNDPLVIGEELLIRAYKAVNREPPEWLREKYIEEEEEDPISVQFLEALRQYVNELYPRVIAKVDFTETTGWRLDALIKRDMIPGAHLRGEDVYITRKLLEELGVKVQLKSLAERLQWAYGVFKLGGEAVRAIRVPLEKLKVLLDGKEAEEKRAEPAPSEGNNTPQDNEVERWERWRMEDPTL